MNGVETDYWNTIEAAAARRLPKRVLRAVKPTLDALKPLYESGGQFFVVVKVNTKELAFKDNPQQPPVRWETLGKWLNQRDKNGRRKYDLAIRTGKWRLPDRNPDEILIGFDSDVWLSLPETVKEILKAHPTFVDQTRRGFHFYFFVPKWFSKSGSNPGIADWLARGKIAVLTGSDRQVLHSRPVATLPEDEARVLYEYATTREQTDETRSYRTIAQSLADFQAVQGERNHRLNGELFRLRHQSAEALKTIALQLAAQCTPPYPPKEALQIVQSILKNRHRFQNTHHRPPQEHKAGFTGNVPYTRLGDCYPKAGMRFTRKEYEQKLIRRGWVGQKSMGVARHDIDAALKMGEIEYIGKLPSGKQGGRPQHQYRRVRNYHGEVGMILPAKPTARLIRLSAMMDYLPDEPRPVTRRALCHYLGVQDVGTISRYSNLLRDENLWGQPLIQKEVQPLALWDINGFFGPYTPGKRLSKAAFAFTLEQFVRYPPSQYQRLPYYHQSIFQHHFAALARRQAEHAQQKIAAEKQARLEQLLARSAPQDQWNIKNALQLIAQKQEKLGLRRSDGLAPKKAGIKGVVKTGLTPCDNVAILSKTLSATAEQGWQRVTQRLPEPEEPPPMVAIPPVIINKKDAAPIISPPVVTGEIAPIPESDLPGYPINRYLGGGETLFEHMEDYYQRRDIPLWRFNEHFSPEEIAAWQRYYFKEVTCPDCHAVRRVHYTKDPLACCEACRLQKAKATPLPADARTVLAQYDTHRFDYLWELFAQTFHTHPRTQKEVRAAIETYGWQWVDFAIRVIGEKQDIRYPWPAVVGTLKNWQQQGYINYDDQRHLMEQRVRQLVEATGREFSSALSYLHHDTVFHAYDRFVTYLTEDTAYLIAEAVRVYGEQAVRHAIEQAFKYNAHRWGYCQQILDRLSG